VTLDATFQMEAPQPCGRCGERAGRRAVAICNREPTVDAPVAPKFVRSSGLHEVRGMLSLLKKLTRKRRLRQIRTARSRKRRKQKCRKRPVRKLRTYHAAPNEIEAPRRVDILDFHGRELGRFIRAVADAVLVRHEAVSLNFRETEAFIAGGTILLFAELDRIKSQSELEKPLTLIDPRRRRAKEVLKQIGLYELTGDSCDVVPLRDDVIYWKATKGANQSGHQMAMIEVVAERVRATYADTLLLHQVWRGVSEAVTNSVEHAYKKPRGDGFNGLAETKWWMFTQVRDNMFGVAVCDLGCGYRATIEETIPEQFISQLAATFAGSSKDARAIHTAMEYGRTGTHYPNRGKGSRDAMSVLESHKAGNLVIISNSGTMAYEFREGRPPRHTSGSLELDVRGTIVLWWLPLRGVGE